MKTQLQRQRSNTATRDRAGGDRATPVNSTPVQAQSAEGGATQSLDMQMQRASERGHSLGNFTIQPALAIGEPGDKYEQEADEIARQAVQMKPQASGVAGAPEDNSSGASSSTPNVQHQLNPTAVQRQPDLDMGSSMPDLGGDLGGMGDMTDAMGGGMDDLAGGGGSGDLGGMADAMGGDGLEDMTDALGGGEMGDAMGAMGGNGEDTMTEEAGPETEEVEEMLGDTNVDMGLGDDGIEGQIRTAIASGGEPLPEEMQAKLRSRIGMENPEDIRVHTGGQANELCDELGALAFTTGNHIFFAAGEYDPDSPEGQELIFHEAVHTIQQGAIDSGSGAEESMEDTGADLGLKADSNQVVSDSVPVQSAATTTTAEEEQTGTSEADGEDMAAEGEKDAQNAVDSESADAPTEGQEAVHTEAPPDEAVGTAQDIFTPVPEVEPDKVPAPEALGNPLEPMQEMGLEEGLDNAQDAASGSMDDLEFGGDAFPDFNAALAQSLAFAGEDAGDVLNLQMTSAVVEQAAADDTVATTEDTEKSWDAGEEVGWPKGMKESDTGSPGGDWIVDNVFLAGTSGKIVDIANVMAGDASWFALKPKHWAHMFGYMAITFEIFINMIELLTGILDMISLALTAVMVLFIMMQGICHGISLLLAAFGNPAAATWAGFAEWWKGLWQVIAGWLVKLSEFIIWWTAFRLLLRFIAIVLWLLDALLAGAVLGWEHAKEGLGRAAVQAVGAAADIVAIILYRATIDAPTDGSSVAPGRDVTDNAVEALTEELVVGVALGGGGGAGFEQAQSSTDSAVQAKADETQIQAVRESNESLDEEYAAYQDAHEESTEALPEIPDADPLATVESASARMAVCDAEDEQTQAAIAETERIIRGKQLWAEDIYGSQLILEDYHAQQEQSQAMSEAFQERTGMASAEIAEAKPTLEGAQDQSDSGAADLNSQQGNIKQGSAMGGLVGQDVPSDQGPVAQQGADGGAKDVAQGPSTSDDGEAAAAGAMKEQGAQAAESAEIQSLLETRETEAAAVQAENQAEIEWLMTQREAFYARWEVIQETRDNTEAEREEGLAEGEDWSSEVFAIIQDFMAIEGADTEDDEDTDNDDDDVLMSEDLEDEEDQPTLDETLENFMEVWQALAEQLGISEDERQDEMTETVVG
ncbi:MAG: DUF4157 domain-containing protein [Leptolyngbyaceae cyanobacterium]